MAEANNTSSRCTNFQSVMILYLWSLLRWGAIVKSWPLMPFVMAKRVTYVEFHAVPVVMIVLGSFAHG